MMILCEQNRVVFPVHIKQPSQRKQSVQTYGIYMYNRRQASRRWSGTDEHVPTVDVVCTPRPRKNLQAFVIVLLVIVCSICFVYPPPPPGKSWASLFVLLTNDLHNLLFFLAHQALHNSFSF